MVVAILLALPATTGPARAAAVTGLYIDGFNDPLTVGSQTVRQLHPHGDDPRSRDERARSS